MKSKNQKVSDFLNDIKEINKDKFEILEKIRSLTLGLNNSIVERMMYGGIIFSLNEDFGGTFVSSKHVSFEFSKGYQMDDPKELLEGTGKFRRHLKISTVDEIKSKELLYFLKQAIK